MLEAYLRATLSADPAAVDPVLTLRVQGGEPDITLELEAVPGASEQLDPTTANGIVPQVLRVALSGAIGGSPFELGDDADSTDGITVDLTLGEKSQWAVRAPASTGRWSPWPLGYEMRFGGAPPPGLAAVNIAAQFGEGDAEFSVPLITSGLSTNSGRTVSESGHAISLSGFGGEARYDRHKVTLQLEPGHGLTHGAIVALLAELAGVPASAMAVDSSIGFALRRAVDFVEEEFWSAASDVLFGCGYVLHWTSGGSLVALPRAPLNQSPTLHRIGARRILGASLSPVDVSGVAEKATCIRVEGIAPVLPDDAGEGVTTEVNVTKSYQVGFLPALSTFSVNLATDVLTASTATAFLALGSGGGFIRAEDGGVLKSMVVTIRTKRGGCILSEETLVFGWYNPEHMRYNYTGEVEPNLEANGTVTGTAWIFESGAVAGDSSKAYLWPTERWCLISRELLTKVENHDTFEAESETKLTGGFLNPESFAKEPSDTTPDWPNEPFSTDVFVTGDGRPVRYLNEKFFGARTTFADILPFIGGTALPGLYWFNVADYVTPLTREETTFEGANGYLIGTDTQREGFAINPQAPGFPPHWFLGDKTSGDLYAEFQDTTSEAVTYSASVGDSSHTAVTVRADQIQRLQTADVEHLAGFLPAMPRCDPSDDARKDGAPFSATVCRPGSRAYNLKVVSSDFVEDAIQAGTLADILLREEHGIPVVLAIPFDPTIRPGDECIVDLPDPQIQGRGWVDKASLELSDRFRYSRITVKLHPN